MASTPMKDMTQRQCTNAHARHNICHRII